MGNKFSVKLSLLYTICFLLLALVFPISAQAATYYVSTIGSDINPGTQSQPWKTIQKAANTAAAGDTVLIKSGSYGETVTFPKSGTSGSPITFKKADTTPPTIKGTEYLTLGIDKKNWIVVDGLNIQGGTDGYGIVVHAGSYNTIKNCDVGNGSIGIHVYTGSYSSPVYGETAVGNIISGNTVHDMSGEAIYNKNYMPSDITTATTQNTLIENNTVYKAVEAVQNTADTFVSGTNNRVAGGIAPSGTIIRGNNIYNNRCDSGVMDIQGNNVLIENNIVHDNPGGTFCSIYIASPGKITVRNNLIYKNGGSASWRAGIYANNVTEAEIYHNTIYGENRGIYIKNPINNVYVKNNIFGSISNEQIAPEGDSNKMLIDTNLFSKNQGTMGSNSIISDPGFVNAASYNFHLLSSSLAIDKGLSLGIISDIEGISRPQGNAPDLGAFEYIGTSATPTPTLIIGDLNADGKVDSGDYTIFVSDFGKTGISGFIPADIIKNGKVDIFDYNVLAGNFGK